MDVKSFVFDLIRSMETAAVLFAALELGILEMLEGEDSEWQEFAYQKRYDIDALETLMNALVATGFLQKRGDRYELTDIARRLLEDPFLVNNLRLSGVYTVMFHYPERVRGEYLHVLSTDELKVITALGQYSASKLIEYLVRLIPALKTESLSLVDLGCGQGYHLAALSLQNPKLRCIGIDAQDEILHMARQNAARHHLENVSLKGGDMRTVNFGSNLDIVTCFTALRGMGKDEMIRLVQRVFASLKRGGYFVIHDFFLENDRTGPIDNVLFDMKLALSAGGGKLLERADFAKLKDIGFDKFNLYPIEEEDIPVKGSIFFIYQK